jgi:hypothetical protein
MPVFIIDGLDSLPFTQQHWVLFDRYDSSQRCAVPFIVVDSIECFFQIQKRNLCDVVTALDPPFERLFYEDFNGGFRFKGG